ncbi:MAG TPA: cation:proton antiporter [Oscillatoriales bacterium UBA8482]|nr:MAG: cation:proton antiporter [Oscillatoriales cyanobacterium CG2_30_40_61]HBW56760.1 cation:proton antiporter [Oscillatoriales bacterium UBA8482]
MENFWQYWGRLEYNFNPPIFAPILAQLNEPVRDPVAVFLIILAIMLVAPLLFERLKMPGIIGLILAGVVVGPHGLGLLARDRTIELLGTVGLLFLMFLGGLETSLDDLKRNADKAVVFGLATFLLPMIIGTGAMLSVGFSPLASILVASCLASHTLVALPVLSKLGIMRSRPVMATLGATLITNVLALLVLAIVVKADQGRLTASFWLLLIPSLAIYTFATLWGIPRLGRWFFRRFGHDESAEFIFVLAALFVASYIAGLIEIEPIVGAFLAGVAITSLVPQLSPLMNRIQFIGNTLFVPFFLISVGMLVDPLILVKEPRGIMVAVVILIAELVSKFLAAWGPGKLFGWKFPSVMVMFGMSMAQAASTLAAITVALKINLVDELTVNGIIVMILVTCVASPLITARWGSKVALENTEVKEVEKSRLSAVSDTFSVSDRILVPVANPNTEDNLLQLALILAKSGGGTLLPLHIISDQTRPIPSGAKVRQEQLLAKAEMVAHAAVTPVETIGRVDNSIGMGIVRTAEERNASLIVCGWKGYSTYQENFFGGMIDMVVRLATIPVLITRFPQPLKNTQRILFVVGEIDLTSWAFRETFSLAQSLSEELKARLQVLQVLWDQNPQASGLELTGVNGQVRVEQIRGNFVAKISQFLKVDDLVIVMASTYGLGQPTLGKDPETIARLHQQTSLLIVHFPT